MRTTFIVILVFLTTGLIAQEPDNDLLAMKDFRPLFEEREKLTEQSRELERSIDALAADMRGLPSVATLELQEKKALRELEAARTKKTPDDALVEKLTLAHVAAKEDHERAKKLAPDLETQQKERERVRSRLFAVEQRIASLFDASRDVNAFRSNVTYTFGVLVFVVIVGFYVIAWNKQGVATTIFSGAMGMQFVTLFLIVIAIILFGIMGTLEGKELSALLGGLSGYILGRADSRRTTTASDSSPEPARASV